MGWRFLEEVRKRFPWLSPPHNVRPLVHALEIIRQEIHKLVYEDQPYTWIYNGPTLCAFNKRIRGVQFSPKGIYDFDPSYFGWWAPAGGGGRAVEMR